MLSTGRNYANRYYYYNYYNIVRVASNVELHKLRIEILDSLFKCEYIPEDLIDVFVYILPYKSMLRKYWTKTDNTLETGLHIKALCDEKALVFRQRVLNRWTLVVIKNLGSDRTEVYLSDSLIKYARLPVRHIYRIDDILNSILYSKFVQKGWILLHSAFVHSPCGNFLISAHGETGKTFTTLELGRKGNFLILADDITIANNSCYAYGIPPLYLDIYSKRPTTFQEKLRCKLYTFLSSIVRLTNYIPLWKTDLRTLLPMKTYPRELIIKANSPVKIDYIFILERGKNQLMAIEAYESFRKMLLLNELEFSYFYQRNYPILMYSYFYDNDFDIVKTKERARAILSSLCKCVRESYIVRAISPSEYANMIYSVLVQ